MLPAAAGRDAQALQPVHARQMLSGAARLMLSAAAPGWTRSCSASRRASRSRRCACGACWTAAPRRTPAGAPTAAGLSPPAKPAEARVLVAAGYPTFERQLTDAGFHPLALDMSEFRKMDGGLSCLSLRF